MLLHIVTWSGMLIIAAGLVLQLLERRSSGPAFHAGATLLNLGVLLFILLPVVRVAVMLVFFRPRA